jgi:predicted peptidase
MVTRREAIGVLGCATAGAWFELECGSAKALATFSAGRDSAPALAPGAPKSPERRALVEAFEKESVGLEKKYEARTHKSGWEMPYRLFRPEGAGKTKLPLVVYLHGSGGLGNDNLKQLGLGNVFGTRVWLLPENQKRYPCYVLAPQTDRGWAKYDFTKPQGAVLLSGLGEGARLTLEIIEGLSKEFAIDDRRIYVTGQSMGGSGTWHITAQRPKFFAAAIPCCGAETDEDAVASIGTPIWNFHGDKDPAVPVQLSRDRIAALQKAGGHPIYTEYAGVEHNAWEWAYTEPELVKWVFAQTRG